MSEIEELIDELCASCMRSGRAHGMLDLRPSDARVVEQLSKTTNESAYERRKLRNEISARLSALERMAKSPHD